MLSKESIKQVILKTSITFEYADVHPDHVFTQLQQLYEQGVNVQVIGRSREDQAIHGVTLGDPEKPAIVLSGHVHGEEVIGTLTIIQLLKLMQKGEALAPLLDDFRIVAIPQLNPDGALHNWMWLSNPSAKTRLAFEWRDHRGEDVEHGIAMGTESFLRPEPKVLVDFYTREVPGVAAFYITFHSSTLESGSYFLTGNEDEGLMGPAFELIRTLCPMLEMPLKNENTNGFHGFRRLGEGLYNVPRFVEMKKEFDAAQMTGKGFMLNSLEWMERRGTPISLVSEVPSVMSARLVDTPVEILSPDNSTYLSAMDFMSPMVNILREMTHMRQGVLHELESLPEDVISDARRLKVHLKTFEGWKSKSPEKHLNALPCFEGQPALMSHETRLKSLLALSRMKILGMAVSVLKPGNLRDAYELELENAWRDLEQSLAPTLTSIDVQVRLQMLLVLSGALCALNQR